MEKESYKKFNLRSIIFRSSMFKSMLVVLLFSLFSVSNTLAFTLNCSFAENNGCYKLKIDWSSENACATKTYNDIWIQIDGVQVYYGSWGNNYGTSGTYFHDIGSYAPGTVLRVTSNMQHKGIFCDYPDNSTPLTVTIPSYQPYENLRASNAVYGDRIVIAWDRNTRVCYTNVSYIVYRGGMEIGRTSSTTYTHYNLPASDNGSYSVQAIANGAFLSPSPQRLGSTFSLNLQASQNYKDKILLSWADFSNTYGANGHIINRWDGTNNLEIVNSSSTTAPGYEDFSPTLIPGFLYRYTVQTKITTPQSNNIVAVKYGKLAPNGTISGSVKTPTGVGVANIKIVAKLKGAALPSDTTKTYFSTTNAKGEYVINSIYYYTEASFDVYPVYAGRNFNPDTTVVTLTKTIPNAANTNFTDKSSFTVSGTIMQGGCFKQGVKLFVDGLDSKIATSDSGKYTLTVSTGGVYTIKPQLGDHAFLPNQKVVTITANTTNINFEDTTKYVLDGNIWGSCQTKLGTAKLRVFDINDKCFSQTINTNEYGYYSAILPARKYQVELTDFVSVDTNIVAKKDVMAFFAKNRLVDLSTIDSTIFNGDTLTNNYIYRIKPELIITGIDKVKACSGTKLPILEMHRPCLVELTAKEAFNGNQCFADNGYVIIRENISSTDLVENIDTLHYTKGQVMKYQITPGSPNIIAPYKKSLQAVLYRDNQTDTVSYEVIVTGHKPRTQTFTTVTPSVPFHILHNPPGDGSYSYLDKNSTISNSFTTSFLQEGSVDAYLTAHLGPSVSFSAGVAVEVGYDITSTVDITANLGFGTSGLSNWASSITTTANERFETAGNSNVTGGAGDVYIGGALNMLYALSDAVLYDFNSCSIIDSVILMMQPTGIKTTFMYSESHITDVIIPELKNISELLRKQGLADSASRYENQLNVWKSVVAKNHQNISRAAFIENKSFSGGVSYENSVETTQSSSYSLDMNYYLDYGLAVDIGLTVAGLGATGGVAVKGRSTWGKLVNKDNSETTTVGYVLSDDDLGDSYSVDIANDSLYGTPVFRVVAGRSSCPWEVKTLPREGVQLLSNNKNQEVSESKPAVFVLQLANTSQSDEAMTYDLVFDHTSNPTGAPITIGGSPVVGNIPYSYTIPAKSSVNTTITVKKGPVLSTYNDLKFTLKSSCDDQISQDIYLNAKFYKEHNLNVTKVGEGTTTPGVGISAIKDSTIVVLDATPATGYKFNKWVINGIETTKNPIYYTVSGNSNAVAHFVLYVNSINAIGNDKNVVRIAPNPSIGFVAIDATEVVERVDVLDVTGRVVFSSNRIDKSKFDLDLNHLKAGVYLVNLFSKTGVSTAKLQIKK